MSSRLDRRVHRFSADGEPSSIVEHVYGQIREGILSVLYPPGAPLNASALADDYRTSPIPIREALRRLEAEGLVDMRPNKGAFVASVSSDDILDLYVARKVVEVGTLRLAMKARSDFDFDLLRRCLREMEYHYSGGDRDYAYRINRTFHMALLAPARAPKLLQIVETLFDASDRYLRIALAGSAEPRMIVDEHQLIYDEVANGTAATAAHALNSHLDRSLKRALASLPDIARLA